MTISSDVIKQIVSIHKAQTDETIAAIRLGILLTRKMPQARREFVDGLRELIVMMRGCVDTIEHTLDVEESRPENKV